jgi:hypothetical protein
MCEDPTVVPRRNGVDPEMAEGRELSVPRTPHESAEPAARDVLEEHSLDGIAGAEPKYLVPLRLDQASGHAGGTLETVPHEPVAANP